MIIEQAKGVLSERAQIGLDEAFARLGAHADGGGGREVLGENQVAVGPRTGVVPEQPQRPEHVVVQFQGDSVYRLHAYGAGAADELGSTLCSVLEVGADTCSPRR